MGPAWTSALRFAPGTRLHFVSTLPDSLRAAAVASRPAWKPWIAELDNAIFTVQSIDDDGCRIIVTRSEDDAALGELTAERGSDGTSRITIDWASGDAAGSRAIDRIALMLGGDDDVYIARRNVDATRQLARLHYGNIVSLSVFPGAIDPSLSPIVRALLPNEWSIGQWRSLST